MMKFLKKLAKAGTTVWGTATVAAVLVNQDPTLAELFMSKENAAIAQRVAGAVAVAAGLATAKKAADAKDLPPQAK